MEIKKHPFTMYPAFLYIRFRRPIKEQILAKILIDIRIRRLCFSYFCLGGIPMSHFIVFSLMNPMGVRQHAHSPWGIGISSRPC